MVVWVSNFDKFINSPTHVNSRHLSPILALPHSKDSALFRPQSCSYTNNAVPESDWSCAICCRHLSLSFFSCSHVSSSSRHRSWTCLEEVSRSWSDSSAPSFAVCALSNWLSSSASVVNSRSVDFVSRPFMSKQWTYHCWQRITGKYRAYQKNWNNT